MLTKLLKNKKILVLGCILIIVFVVIILNKDSILKTIYPKKYETEVTIYAEKYQVEENLIYALIKAESNFDEGATSHKGAIGLMQLMEETAKDVVRKNALELEEENIRNELLIPENNINVGTKYLSTLLERYQNKGVALAAYNAGIGTVDNWIEKGVIQSDGSDIENIPFKETNQYVRKILRDYEIYCALYSF